VLVERVPLASAGAGGLAVILVLRTLLGSATQAAAGDVADAARLALRERVFARLLAMARCGCGSAAPANWAN
jgi:ATP-binding cassette subfamily C protein CydD